MKPVNSGISRLLILGLIVTFFNASLTLAQRKAVTDDGQRIFIFDDGTWQAADTIELIEQPISMPIPAFQGMPAKSERKVKPPRLTLLEQRANQITDVEAWFSGNDLKLAEFEVPNSFREHRGNCPPGTPLSYKGQMLIRAFYSDQEVFLVYGKDFSYGQYLVITDRGMKECLFAINFSNYVLAPEYVAADRDFIDQGVIWAEKVDNILYVSHAHRTYASSSKGMNAYITAIDLTTMSVLWRTKPLLCNTLNFVVLGDVIISGYGFTAEPDFLYTIDRYTGNMLSKVSVKTGPEYVIRKGDRLYVRTYDTDYIFKIQ